MDWARKHFSLLMFIKKYFLFYIDQNQLNLIKIETMMKKKKTF